MIEQQRRLARDDLAGCVALSDEAGWNQTEADWRLILSLGEAMGVIRSGQLIGTAAYVPYGERFGWICMVLVTAEERRRGHATRLLRWAIGRLDERGLVAGLDATPQGREVYRRLGFRDVYGLTRWQAVKAPAPTIPGDAVVRPMAGTDVARVATADAGAFGADRRALLDRLRERSPHLAFLADSPAGPSGHGLGRGGRRATQIGPVVADSEAAAKALIAAALAAIEGPVFIDLCDGHAGVADWLRRHGFALQRPFTRMLAGRSAPLDDPGRVVAATGPEFG